MEGTSDETSSRIQTRGRTSGVRKSVIPSSLVTIHRRTPAERQAAASTKCTRSARRASAIVACVVPDEEDDGVTECVWLPRQIVLAQDERGDWYSARVISVDGERRRVHVHFNGWNARHDLLLPFNTKRIRDTQMQQPHERSASPCIEGNAAQHEFKVGDFVMAKWLSYGKLLPAKVVEIDKEQEKDLKLVFEDGLELRVWSKKTKHMTEADFNRFHIQDLEHFGEQLIVREEYKPPPVVVHGKRPSKLREHGRSGSTTRASSAAPSEAATATASPTVTPSPTPTPEPTQSEQQPKQTAEEAPKQTTFCPASALEEEQPDEVSPPPRPTLCIDLTTTTHTPDRHSDREEEDDEPMVIKEVVAEVKKKKKKKKSKEKRGRDEREGDTARKVEKLRIKATMKSDSGKRERTASSQSCDGKLGEKVDSADKEPAESSTGAMEDNSSSSRPKRRASKRLSAGATSADGEHNTPTRHSKRLRSDETQQEQQHAPLTVRLSLRDVADRTSEQSTPAQSKQPSPTEPQQTAHIPAHPEPVVPAPTQPAAPPTPVSTSADDSLVASPAALPVALNSPPVKLINLDLTFTTYSAGRTDWLKRDGALMYCVACRHYADSAYERTQLPMVRGCSIALVHEIRVHENLDTHERRLRAYYADVLRTNKADTSLSSPEGTTASVHEYVCPIISCGKSYRSELHLQTHYRHMHNESAHSKASTASPRSKRRQRIESTMSTATDVSESTAIPASPIERSPSPTPTPMEQMDDDEPEAVVEEQLQEQEQERVESRESSATGTSGSSVCEQCETWQHGECVNIQPGLMPRPYLCTECIVQQCARREYKIIGEEVQHKYITEGVAPSITQADEEQENQEHKEVTLVANHLVQQLHELTACLRSVRVRVDLHQHTKDATGTDQELMAQYPLLQVFCAPDGREVQGGVRQRLDAEINSLHPVFEQRLNALQLQVIELEQRVARSSADKGSSSGGKPKAEAAPADTSKVVDADKQTTETDKKAAGTDEQTTEPEKQIAGGETQPAEPTRQTAGADEQQKPAADENQMPPTETLPLQSMSQLYTDVGKLHTAIELATSEPVAPAVAAAAPVVETGTNNAAH